MHLVWKYFDTKPLSVLYLKAHAFVWSLFCTCMSQRMQGGLTRPFFQFGRRCRKANEVLKHESFVSTYEVESNMDIEKDGL